MGVPECIVMSREGTLVCPEVCVRFETGWFCVSIRTSLFVATSRQYKGTGVDLYELLGLTRQRV